MTSTSNSTSAAADDGIVTAARIVTNCLFSLSAIVGIPGNLLVLLVIVRHRQMHTVSNVFIFNLALADLLFLLSTPVVVARALSKSWQFGLVGCKALLTSNAVNQFQSSLVMGVLSLDRFLAVCSAVRSRRWRTPSRAVALSLVCWLLVALEMAPIVLAADLVRLPWNTAGPQCVIRWRWGLGQSHSAAGVNGTTERDDLMALFGQLRMSRLIFTTYSFCLSYLLPLVCVWFFYCQIIVSLWRRRSQLFKTSQRRAGQTTIKVTIMGLAIVVSYTVCWLPFWFVQWSLELDAGWVKTDGLLVVVSLSAYALQYINSALNPFLYVFLTDYFRQVLRGRRHCSASNNDHGRLTALSAAANENSCCSPHIMPSSHTLVGSISLIDEHAAQSSVNWRPTERPAVVDKPVGNRLLVPPCVQRKHMSSVRNDDATVSRPTPNNKYFITIRINRRETFV